MTKEELEKEAEKWLRKFLLCNDCKRKCHCIELNAYCEEQVLKAYIDSAEPREKQIVELETRCNELFLQTWEQAEKIKELNAEIENDRDLPAIAYMQGAEKQKKKDEEELKKWKDEWQEQVQKATDEGYARTLQTIQLSKAKEILKSLYFIIESRIDYKNNIGIADEMWRAKQFLKGE